MREWRRHTASRATKPKQKPLPDYRNREVLTHRMPGAALATIEGTEPITETDPQPGARKPIQITREQAAKLKR